MLYVDSEAGAGEASRAKRDLALWQASLLSTLYVMNAQAIELS